MRLFRSSWWPGPGPNISKERVMCDKCQFHSAAMAGWQWDRCSHPDADYGSVVRNDQQAKCYDMRMSNDQCGEIGKWFTPKARAQGKEGA